MAGLVDVSGSDVEVSAHYHENGVGAEGGDAGRRPRRTRVWIAGAVVVALVGGGMAWWGVDQAAERALTDSLAALNAAVSDLDKAVTAGSAVLGKSEGRVEDDRVRTDLATALESATALDTDPPVDGKRSARTDAAAALTAEVTEQASVVTVASERVSDAVAAWELAQATTAHDAAALSAAIITGEQVFTDTDGRVADNTVREQLRTALDAAIAIRDTAPGAQSLDALHAAAGAADTARIAVEAAAQSATDAHSAWQGEQDRIAAEQATAAQSTPGWQGLHAVLVGRRRGVDQLRRLHLLRRRRVLGRGRRRLGRALWRWRPVRQQLVRAVLTRTPSTWEVAVR